MHVGLCKVCKSILHIAGEDMRDLVMDNVVTVETTCQTCGAVHEVLDPGGTTKLVAMNPNWKEVDRANKSKPDKK
jgi:hypothetical protein